MRTDLFGHVRGRVLAVVVALLAVQLGSLVAPAYACGCGAMVPDGQRHMSVHREVSAVRWDGRREQIVMSLTVAGDARRAAWIMPVPHRATVRLGDRALFDQLDTATAPEYSTRHHFWPRRGDWPFTGTDDTAAAPPRAGAAAPPVGVVGRERLGPFDVARLTATDPNALGSWLRDNGFRLPPRLSQALRPYVDQGWEYVAVRLAPDRGGSATLAGTLDPLHLTFASDRLVYPMRLSHLASTPQSLGLFVLAAHRVRPRSAIGGDRPQVLYAGRISAASGALARLTAGGTDFLTAFDQEFPQPSRISGDHELERTATDTTYRRIVYTDALLTAGGVPVWQLTVLGTSAAAAAVLVAVVRGRRRRVVPPPPVHTPPPIG
ncbi:DUF2330 domain-containing protein [Streptomyces sp. TP-A0356]|uniref:DUF2330 domain-containing protein n=1 Tax=Streptomyces sp. TP-A0356 TaxID=1359208 RepID=UPI0006E11F29|nr:DUF2330 domain-containing protein [Streptomyces sp. TP-A0356]